MTTIQGYLRSAETQDSTKTYDVHPAPKLGIELGPPGRKVDTLQISICINTFFFFLQGFELNKKLLGKVKVIFAATTAMDVIKWISVVTGLGLGGVSAFLMKKMKEANEINVVLGRIPKAITPLEIRSRY